MHEDLGSSSKTADSLLVTAWHTVGLFSTSVVAKSSNHPGCQPSKGVPGNRAGEGLPQGKRVGWQDREGLWYLLGTSFSLLWGALECRLLLALTYQR